MKRSICIGALAASLVPLFAPCSSSAAPNVLPSVQSSSVQSPAAPSLDQAIRSNLHVTRYSLQRLNVPAQPGDPFSFGVTLGVNAVRVDLELRSIRADGFRVMVDEGSGKLTRVEPPPVATYRGHIAGHDDTDVRAGIKNTGLDAVITLGDGSVWGIQAARAALPTADPSLYVVYSASDVSGPPGICGTVDADGAPNGVDHDPGSDGVPRGGTVRIADIAFDADFEYYQANGSSVPATVSDIEVLINAVEGIYEINTPVTYEITTIIVRSTSADPYSGTDPGAMLSQFATYWQANYTSGPNIIRKDVAQLFTNRNMDGSVIGIANLSSVCNSNGYSVVQSRYTTNTVLRRSLSAHELGHTWSAQHCDGSGTCNIMCSCNGCGPPNCTGIFTSFGAGEATQITNFANGRSCLLIQPATITPPFSEMFADASISTNWVYIDGVVLSTSAVNPPSSPRCIQLNALNSNEFSDDEIRTHFINMTGVTMPVVSYWAEARGVPAGGQLIVEGLNNLQHWVNLNTITSDGVDDPTFTQYTHTLSAQFLHSEFRLRFRVDVNGPTENWYVDDVFVGTSSAPATGACCLSNGTCQQLSQANCSTNGGTYQGDSTSCGPGACPEPPGACCLSNGLCIQFADAAGCAAAGGTWNGAGSSCGAPGICVPPSGACCMPDGTCMSVAPDECDSAGGVYQGDGSSCGNANCPQPTGACCLADGTCSPAVTAAACTAAGGTYQGDGSACSNQCPIPTGACCVNGVCSVISHADCTAQGGSYQGDGSACGANTCGPACPCDFNNSGSLNSQDFFDFLNAFFAADIAADFNHDTQVNSQDFFDYLGCFFNPPGGC